MLIIASILIIIAGIYGIYEAKVKKKSFFKPSLNEKWGQEKSIKYSIYFSIALIVMGLVAISLNWLAFFIENPIKENSQVLPTPITELKGKSSVIAFKNFANYLEDWSDQYRVSGCKSSLDGKEFKEVMNGEFPAWECEVFSIKDMNQAVLKWDGEKVTVKDEKKIEDSDKEKYEKAAYIEYFEDAISSTKIIEEAKKHQFDEKVEYSMILYVVNTNVPTSTIVFDKDPQFTYIWEIRPKKTADSKLINIYELDAFTGSFKKKKVSLSQ